MLYTLIIVISVVSQGVSTYTPLTEYKSLATCYAEGVKVVAAVTKGIPETKDRKVKAACVANYKPQTRN